jgi:hypothetical protein
LAAQGGVFAAGAAPSREALQAAQARLMADKTLQFTFAKSPPPPELKPTPGWLKALEAFLSGVGGVMNWVFWGGVALIVALILYFVIREILRARWPERFKRPPKAAPAEPEWRPEAAVARALLDEADRLAAEGRYAEAVHLILYRSIEDIQGHRPALVRPAFTTREIAGLDGLPSAARSTFQTIAHVVEHSFFGGRDVDAAGFSECRQAYEHFAFPGAWA